MYHKLRIERIIIPAYVLNKPVIWQKKERMSD
jgi:hypothetical protein